MTSRQVRYVSMLPVTLTVDLLGPGLSRSFLCDISHRKPRRAHLATSVRLRGRLGVHVMTLDIWQDASSQVRAPPTRGVPGKSRWQMR